MPACAHLATADYDLRIEDGSLALSTDHAVQRARPSIDVLLEAGPAGGA